MAHIPPARTPSRTFRAEFVNNYVASYDTATPIAIGGPIQREPEVDARNCQHCGQVGDIMEPCRQCGGPVADLTPKPAVPKLKPITPRPPPSDMGERVREPGWKVKDWWERVMRLGPKPVREPFADGGYGGTCVR